MLGFFAFIYLWVLLYVAATSVYLAVLFLVASAVIYGLATDKSARRGLAAYVSSTIRQLRKDGRDGNRREPIPQNVKIYVRRRDQGMCVRCGSRERLEYDHMIPVSQGGSNTARNLELLFEQCNRQKGARIHF